MKFTLASQPFFADMPVLHRATEAWQMDTMCAECERDVKEPIEALMIDKEIGRYWESLCEPCAEAYALAYAVGA